MSELLGVSVLIGCLIINAIAAWRISKLKSDYYLDNVYPKKNGKSIVKQMKEEFRS